MALRTSGVGTERKLEIWDQYGVKKYDFSPSEMVTPGEVTFEFEKLLLSDTDVTPIGAVLLKVLDQKLKLRNAADDADVILEEGSIPHTFANIVNFDGGIKAAGVESTDNIVLSGATGVRRFQGIVNIEGAKEASLTIQAGCYPEIVKTVVLSLAGSPENGAMINLYGEEWYGGAIRCFTPNAAKDSGIQRLEIAGAADVVDAIWASVLQSGLKLKDALDANSQKITGLGAPAAVGDAFGAPSGIAQGDIFYWNGSTLVRLPLGTAGQALKVNAGATAPEWVT